MGSQVHHFPNHARQSIGSSPLQRQQQRGLLWVVVSKLKMKAHISVLVMEFWHIELFSRLQQFISISNILTLKLIVATKGTQASKVPVLSGTKKVLLKPALSSKFSSLSSSTTSKMQSTRSTSSNSTVLPETTAKSSLMIARRNPIKSRTLNSASSGSIPKNLSKAKVKNDRSSSALSAYLVSAMTSNMSPTSSIDELSSASSSSSSSSSSTINRRSNNSRNSLDTSSGQSVGGDIVSLDLKNQYTNGIANGHKSRGTASPGNITRKSSTQASKAGTLSSQPPPKVSGLRMPSPKIGFFDGVSSAYFLILAFHFEFWL